MESSKLVDFGVPEAVCLSCSYCRFCGFDCLLVCLLLSVARSPSPLLLLLLLLLCRCILVRLAVAISLSSSSSWLDNLVLLLS